MKKAIFGCLVVVLVTCAAFVGLAGFRANVHVFAQDRTKTSVSPQTGETSIQADPVRVRFRNLPVYSDGVTFERPAEAVGTEIGFSREHSEMQKLRAEYGKIAQNKAALMSLDELRKAVESSRADFAELRAAKELETAVGNLNKIIEQYPNSKAAKSARKLLGQPDQTDDADETNEADGDEAAADSEPKTKPIRQPS